MAFLLRRINGGRSGYSLGRGLLAIGRVGGLPVSSAGGSNRGIRRIIRALLHRCRRLLGILWLGILGRIGRIACGGIVLHREIGLLRISADGSLGRCGALGSRLGGRTLGLRFTLGAIGWGNGISVSVCVHPSVCLSVMVMAY